MNNPDLHLSAYDYCAYSCYHVKCTGFSLRDKKEQWSTMILQHDVMHSVVEMNVSFRLRTLVQGKRTETCDDSLILTN